MEKEFVDVIFILDMSGSMDVLKEDVIGGYNSLIKKLKEENANVLITTVVFNTDIKTIFTRESLDSIKELDNTNYCPSGCTALLDAIGTTFDKFDKYNEKTKSSSTLVYITTDGLENSSKKYNYSLINKMIKWYKKKENWEINFLAANIDEEKIGEELGIDNHRIVGFSATHKGFAEYMEIITEDVLSSATTQGIAKHKKIVDRKK